MEPSFLEVCYALREELKKIETSTKEALDNREFKEEQEWIGQHGDMKANLTLAFRHIEDARMRIGKAIQARDGGISCYPK